MTERICSFPTCNRPIRCVGVCGGHYQQVRGGRPLTSLRDELTVVDRFWQKVDRGADGCWEWQASRNPAGYGYAKDDAGKTVYAHRLSWQIEHGQPIPAGMLVCHVCDNPPCVRPSHLFLGSYLDNARDRDAKGRVSRMGAKSPQRGEEHYGAKLTLKQVQEIRAAWAVPHGPRSGLGRRLAVKYGVQARTISAVVTGRTWKHVA